MATFKPSEGAGVDELQMFNAVSSLLSTTIHPDDALDLITKQCYDIFDLKARSEQKQPSLPLTFPGLLLLLPPLADIDPSFV